MKVLRSAIETSSFFLIPWRVSTRGNTLDDSPPTMLTNVAISGRLVSKKKRVPGVEFKYMLPGQKKKKKQTIRYINMLGDSEFKRV